MISAVLGRSDHNSGRRPPLNKIDFPWSKKWQPGTSRIDEPWWVRKTGSSRSFHQSADFVSRCLKLFSTTYLCLFIDYTTK